MRPILTLAALASAWNWAAAAQRFEFKMISSGPNRPGIALWSAPFRDILVGLHQGVALSDLAARLRLDQARLLQALDSLRQEGVVIGLHESPRPTCMVVTAEEGAILAAHAAEATRQALPLMKRAVLDVRATYREIAGLSHLEFDDVSFFLVSDVLLDNWQINAVEARWLQAERPRRGRSRYYCAFLARSADEREAFGIYGNQMSGLGGGRLLGVYGNRRGGGNDLGSLSRARLAELVALPDTTDRRILLNRLLDDVQRSVRSGEDLPPRLVAGLGPMGLTRGARPLIAVLDIADARWLDALASSLTDSLVAQLESATSRLREAWIGSRWHDETTFAEYRIWWYHFFYTALTDQLAADGAIRVPETGLFHYLMIQ